MPMLSQGMVTPIEIEYRERDQEHRSLVAVNQRMELKVFKCFLKAKAAAKSVSNFNFTPPYQAQHPDASEWSQNCWGGQ